MFRLVYFMDTARGKYKTSLGTNTIWIEEDKLCFIFGRKVDSTLLTNICSIGFNGVEYSNKNGDLFKGVD